MFKAKVRKVGSSLGLLIPKDYAEEENIHLGETVDVGLLKGNRERLIEESFGLAKGAKPFKRDKSDRSGRL